MFKAIEGIKESGLIDSDEDEAWFRYKGVLISFIEGYTFWYSMLTPKMDDESQFDVRALDTYLGDNRQIEAYIKAAIDSGELEACYS